MYVNTKTYESYLVPYRYIPGCRLIYVIMFCVMSSCYQLRVHRYVLDQILET